MSLTRKMLSAMGIEPEKIEEIISAHADTVSALNDKVDKAQADTKKAEEKAEELKAVQKELDELREKVQAEAKEREGKDYDALKKEYDDYKVEVQRKAVRDKKEAAYKEILADAGIPEKHYAKILKYSDVDGVELDEKGKITTAKEILKEIKEEWGDHVEQKKTEGAPTPAPPANDGGKKMTKEEIMAIKDRAERQKAISENHEVFGY